MGNYQENNRHQPIIIALGFLIVLVLITGRATAESKPTLSDKSLVAALHGGGYNLYFRHVATDWSQHDDVRKAGDWLSCDGTRMRQLSSAGRETAVAIGLAIRNLGIPVGKVLASPYCRTVETARLMQIGPVEPTTAVMNLRSADYFGGRAAIIATAQALLSTVPDRDSNTLIVAHGNVAREATPVYPGEGDGIVFEPDGKGGFRYIGQLTPADWSRIMNAAPD
jgi:phosphohistidine phosphatase SixA